MPRYNVPRLYEIFRREGGRRDASALDMLPLVLVLGRVASKIIHFGGNDLKSYGVLATASARLRQHSGRTFRQIPHGTRQLVGPRHV